MDILLSVERVALNKSKRLVEMHDRTNDDVQVLFKFFVVDSLPLGQLNSLYLSQRDKLDTATKWNR